MPQSIPNMAKDDLATGATRPHRDGDLRRLVFWGMAAAAATLGAALASTTDTGRARIGQALVQLWLGPPVVPGQVLEPPDDTETRRLALAMHGLRIDREQLIERISILERSFEDITGSVVRPSNAAAPVQPPVAAIPRDVVFTTATLADRPTAFAEAEAQAAPQIGVDVGGAVSVARLRLQWIAIKARHARALGDLRPAMTVREFGSPTRTELRLLVGPLADASAAIRVCAMLLRTGVKCVPGHYDGYQLPW
jgi:hypothetical protein